MDEASASVAFISLPGGWEWLIIAFLGLLIFGKRLPEVGKSLGKSIVEFKKGLKGVEDDLDRAGGNNHTDMLPPPEKPKSNTGPSEGESQ